MDNNFNDVESIIENPQGFLSLFLKNVSTKRVTEKSGKCLSEHKERVALCKNINQARVKFGLTSKVLAEALGTTPVTISYIKLYSVVNLSTELLLELNSRLEILVENLNKLKTYKAVEQSVIEFGKRTEKVDTDLLKNRAMEEILKLWLSLDARKADVLDFCDVKDGRKLLNVLTYLSSVTGAVTKPSCKKVLEALVILRDIKPKLTKSCFASLDEKASMYYKVKCLLKEKKVTATFLNEHFGVTNSIISKITKGMDDVSYKKVSEIIAILESL